ncbi:MAG: TetR family transcriptional regulator [Hyphomicrobiaceae bacterium]|nr:TetR family transcriptional regulator [Hyphomicrobiaceae bacterium]
MLDLTTENGRYISAALALASERPWQDVTLAEIAERAGSTLVGLKKHFSSKADIVREFIRLVDDEVLARAPRRDEGQAARDALFEVVMSRFDVLEPWKGAVRSIVKSGAPDPGQMMQAIASQRWMLEAAGIGSDGLDGAMRTAGLAAVYAAVFRTWLDDSDPGLARTMAALDRRLRRGERTMRRAEDVMTGFGRIAGAIFGAADTIRSRVDEARRGPARSAPNETGAPPPI